MAPLSIPASVLPLAETCPGVLDLAAREPARGLDSLWREAFTVGALPPTTHSLDAFKHARERLPDLLAVDVVSAIEDYQADTRDGVEIATLHRFAFEVDGDLDGRVPAKGDTRIHHRIDCAWCVVPGAEPGNGRAMVLQHELARFGERDVMGLDLVFAGIAMSALYEVPNFQVGRCYHKPGKPPVYKWSDVIGEEAAGAYWERIARVFRRRRDLITSDLCERCPLRLRCPSWMLPAVYGGRAPYRFLTGQDPETANDVPAIKRYAAALREAAEVADARVRTLARDGSAA